MAAAPGQQTQARHGAWCAALKLPVHTELLALIGAQVYTGVGLSDEVGGSPEAEAPSVGAESW